MFTKQNIQNLFEINKGKNFIIYTNIPNTNGGYNTFYSIYIWFVCNVNGEIVKCFSKTKILGVNEHYVIVEVVTFDGINTTSCFHCFPYESILCITFA